MSTEKVIIRHAANEQKRERKQSEPLHKYNDRVNAAFVSKFKEFRWDDSQRGFLLEKLERKRIVTLGRYQENPAGNLSQIAAVNAVNLDAAEKFLG